MQFHKFLLALSILLLTFSSASATDEEWRPLFNGEDLEGWTPKIRGYEAGENFGNTFRVEDGVLKVVYDQYDGKFNERFGHLFFDEEFSNYRLRVEYRVVGEQIARWPTSQANGQTSTAQNRW